MDIKEEIARQVSRLKDQQKQELKAQFPKVTKKPGEDFVEGDIVFVLDFYSIRLGRYVKTTVEEEDRWEYNVHHVESFNDLPNSIRTRLVRVSDKEISFDYHEIVENEVNKYNRRIQDLQSNIKFARKCGHDMAAMLKTMYK